MTNPRIYNKRNGIYYKNMMFGSLLAVYNYAKDEEKLLGLTSFNTFKKYFYQGFSINRSLVKKLPSQFKPIQENLAKYTPAKKVDNKVIQENIAVIVAREKARSEPFEEESQDDIKKKLWG